MHARGGYSEGVIPRGLSRGARRGALWHEQLMSRRDWILEREEERKMEVER